MSTKAQGEIPELSVVVPVYRTPEKLLRGALDSILASEGVTLELICVDDCPGCESSKVLEEYRNRDPRVVLLVNDRNRGVSHSRNRGLAAARGAWLAFQDSDDRVTPDGYARLIAFAQEHGLDAARGRFVRDFNAPLSSFGELAPGESCVASTTQTSRVLQTTLEMFRWSACGGVYRRTALQGCNFPELLTRYEDGVFIASFLLAERKVGCLNIPLYLYVARGESLSHRVPTVKEYVTYATAAGLIAQAMRQVRNVVAEDVLRYYARWCLHILFSDRRGFERVQGRRQRKAFCAGAREVAWVIAPYVAWHLRWTLRLVALWPRMLFWPGRVAWNLIKLEAGRTFP